MNSLKKCFIFYLFINYALAFENEKSFELTSSSTHRKIFSKHLINISGSVIKFDGVSLSPTETTIKAARLSGLKILPSTSEVCSGGFFQYKIITDKTIVVEKGCLNSKRYEELIFAFNSIKPEVIFK